MNASNDMQALVTRTEQLVNAISGAILSTTEIACERLELAAQVARVQQRMSAFGAVLEAVGTQKAALAARLADATGPLRKLLERQIEMLTVQEVAILEKAGVPQVMAEKALAAVDASSNTDMPATTYRREGKRFVRLELEASRDRNGAAHNRADGKEQDNED
ncbi:MAG: hypothetical protein K8U57_02270 [Planctomycetes bacterium]|nr:hypothetical protein [Planctomycetota bacterium]